MYCNKCGAQNGPNVKFCQSCGAPMDSAPPMGGAQRMQHASGENQVMQVVRAAFTSPLYLVFTIALSCALAFQLLSAFSGASNMSAILDLLSEYGGYEYAAMMDEVSSYIMGAAYSSTMIVTLIGMIPSILILVGAWLMFAAARSTQTEMKVTGLTITRVITIIRLVLLAIFGILILIGILCGFSVMSSRLSSPGAGWIVLALVLWGAIFGVQAIYDLKIISTIDTIRGTITSSRADDSISVFVAVMCYIIGGLNVFGIFMTNFFGAINVLGTATAYISLGIFLFSYRGKMQALLSGRPVAVSAPQSRPQANGGYQQANGGYQQAAPAAAPTQPQWNPPQDNGTTVLSQNSDNGTVVLSNAGMTPLAHLTRQKDQSYIAITKPVFRIGKGVQNIDYCISDNSAISHHHADILYDNGTYFLVDQNSTNHVYLNNQLLCSGAKYKLENGANLRLGNEAFTFQMDSGM